MVRQPKGRASLLRGEVTQDRAGEDESEGVSEMEVVDDYGIMRFTDEAPAARPVPKRRGAKPKAALPENMRVEVVRGAEDLAALRPSDPRAVRWLKWHFGAQRIPRQAGGSVAVGWTPTGGRVEKYAAPAKPFSVGVKAAALRSERDERQAVKKQTKVARTERRRSRKKQSVQVR
eukprot:Hpha_TRINITY_DN15915_c5_g2::TRINITY_DN15915_c5_g2_i2::g.73251::m.73251